MTLLDDLLVYDDEPRRRRRSGAAKTVIITIIVSLAVAWFAWFMLRVLGIGAPFILIAGAIAMLSALRAILVSVDPPDLPQTLRHIPSKLRGEREQPSDGMRDAVRLWENRLEWTHRDLRRFQQVVQPALAELVDERLRRRQGVSLVDEPAKAQRLVDPQLWSFIHDQIRRSPTPKEMSVLVAKMEAL